MKKFLEKTKGIRTFIGVTIFTLSIFLWIISSFLSSIFYFTNINIFNSIQAYSLLVALSFFLYKQLTSKVSRKETGNLLSKFFSKRPKREVLEVPKETCQKCGQNRTKK